MDCLKESDVEKLSEYLNAVVIPQWNTVVKESEIKPKKVESTRHWLFV